MVDVGGITRFTPGERTLRLVMDIAAALERYRIVMEGPSGVRLRKLVDFMLDMILRTLKARGESQGGKKKVVRKGGKKTVDLLLELIRGNPKIIFAEKIRNGIPNSDCVKSFSIYASESTVISEMGLPLGRSTPTRGLVERPDGVLDF